MNVGHPNGFPSKGLISCFGSRPMTVLNTDNGWTTSFISSIHESVCTAQSGDSATTLVFDLETLENTVPSSSEFDAVSNSPRHVNCLCLSTLFLRFSSRALSNLSVSESSSSWIFKSRALWCSIVDNESDLFDGPKHLSLLLILPCLLEGVFRFFYILYLRSRPSNSCIPVMAFLPPGRMTDPWLTVYTLRVAELGCLCGEQAHSYYHDLKYELRSFDIDWWNIFSYFLLAV